MAPAGAVHVDLSLAALLAGGGLYGYAKKKSLPSLIAGVALGSTFALAAYLTNSVDAKAGHATAIGGGVLLTAAMGSRLYKTGKFMPAGLLTAAGALAVAYHANKIRDWL